MKKIAIYRKNIITDKYAILLMTNASDKQGYILAENQRLIICIRTAKILYRLFKRLSQDAPIVVVAQLNERNIYQPILTFMNTDTAQDILEQPTDQISIEG